MEAAGVATASTACPLSSPQRLECLMPRGRYSPRRHDVHEACAAPLWIDTETVSAWAKVRSVPSIVSVVFMVSGVFLRGVTRSRRKELCALSR